MGYTDIIFLCFVVMFALNGYTEGLNYQWPNTWNSNPFQRVYAPTTARPRRNNRTRPEKIPECPSDLRHDAKPKCKARKSGEAMGCPKTTCKFYPTYGEVAERGEDKKNIFGKWRKILRAKDGSHQKSYTAKICRNPNKICHCSKGSSCNKCSNSEATVCTQKWSTKYDTFYIEDLAENYNKSNRFKVSARQLSPEEELEALGRHFNGAKDFRTSDEKEMSNKPPKLPTPSTTMVTTTTTLPKPSKSTLPSMSPSTPAIIKTPTKSSVRKPQPTPSRMPIHTIQPMIASAPRSHVVARPVIWSRTPRYSYHDQMMQVLMWRRFLYAMTFHQNLSGVSQQTKRQRSKSKSGKSNSKSESRSFKGKQKVRMAIKIPSGCSCRKNN